MRSFTDEEFDVMLRELTVNDPPSFQMLAVIAEKTLRSSIVRWCREDKRLAGRQLEDDIMQTTIMRMMQKCITGFFLRTDKLNDDPEGFNKWMFEVARNMTRDFADSQGRLDGRERGFEEGEAENIAAEDDTEREAADERLAAAFAIIIDADVKIYKILTWLAECAFIIEHGKTKIESNAVLAEEFAEKTLRELCDTVYEFAENIPWMNFTPQQRRKIQAALCEPYENGKTYGETKYKEFFMKKDGKATISDWMNRMDGMIKRRLIR